MHKIFKSTLHHLEAGDRLPGNIGVRESGAGGAWKTTKMEDD